MSRVCDRGGMVRAGFGEIAGAVEDDRSRLTDEFIAAFSHELRTPLNAIVGYADILTDSLGPSLDEDSKRALDAITRSATRLTNLINDTLDLARLRIGVLRPDLRRFDAARLVAEVVESFAPVAAAKGLTMACSVPPAALAVHSDAHRLRQTLQYVIHNAVKFTPHGEVLVQVRGTEDDFMVEVQDTGIGISALDLPHVFEDFRQVDGSSTRSYDGCGLGLAVGRRLVTMLGGVIDVESQPGHGSCFRITLPRDLARNGNET